MHNAMYSADMIQPKPITNRELTAFIFPQTAIHFICSTSSKTRTAELTVNTMQRSRAVHVLK